MLSRGPARRPGRLHSLGRRLANDEWNGPGDGVGLARGEDTDGRPRAEPAESPAGAEDHRPTHELHSQVLVGWDLKLAGHDGGLAAENIAEGAEVEENGGEEHEGERRVPALRWIEEADDARRPRHLRHAQANCKDDAHCQAQCYVHALRRLVDAVSWILLLGGGEEESSAGNPERESHVPQLLARRCGRACAQARCTHDDCSGGADEAKGEDRGEGTLGKARKAADAVPRRTTGPELGADAHEHPSYRGHAHGGVERVRGVCCGHGLRHETCPNDHADEKGETPRAPAKCE
mmetsp:Transcript_15425/g.45090  ORF Transcript_15425/g.45090 Transcript_15425/m.45090 type:complete len:292 (+) Transcript_15425:533-1408(+)